MNYRILNKNLFHLHPINLAERIGDLGQGARLPAVASAWSGKPAARMDMKTTKDLRLSKFCPSCCRMGSIEGFGRYLEHGRSMW